MRDGYLNEEARRAVSELLDSIEEKYNFPLGHDFDRFMQLEGKIYRQAIALRAKWCRNTKWQTQAVKLPHGFIALNQSQPSTSIYQRVSNIDSVIESGHGRARISIHKGMTSFEVEESADEVLRRMAQAEAADV